MHDASRLDGPLQEVKQGTPRRVANTCHSHPSGCPAYLSSAAITTNALLFLLPRPLCTQPPFPRRRRRFPIHLHKAVKSVSARTDHRTPKLMHPDPGCLVAVEPQNLLQTDGAGTVLLAGHVPDGPKPHPQRLMRVLKDGSGGDRSLVAALATDVSGLRAAGQPLRFWQRGQRNPSGQRSRWRYARQASSLPNRSSNSRTVRG